MNFLMEMELTEVKVLEIIEFKDFNDDLLM
jgi:hypothetical protein